MNKYLHLILISALIASCSISVEQGGSEMELPVSTRGRVETIDSQNLFQVRIKVKEGKVIWENEGREVEEGEFGKLAEMYRSSLEEDVYRPRLLVAADSLISIESVFKLLFPFQQRGFTKFLFQVRPRNMEVPEGRVAVKELNFPSFALADEEAYLARIYGYSFPAESPSALTKGFSKSEKTDLTEAPEADGSDMELPPPPPPPQIDFEERVPALRFSGYADPGGEAIVLRQQANGTLELGGKMIAPEAFERELASAQKNAGDSDPKFALILHHKATVRAFVQALEALEGAKIRKYLIATDHQADWEKAYSAEHPGWNSPGEENEEDLYEDLTDIDWE